MSSTSGASWPNAPANSLNLEGIEPEVQQALAEVTANINEGVLLAWPDGEGGAFVVVDDLDLGERWAPRQGWLGCRILNSYPDSELYPFYIRADARRVDGVDLSAPFNLGQSLFGQPATTVSRQPNRPIKGPRSAAVRFINVVDFVRTFS